MQGEDVEHAIRSIKSTCRVLKCSSTQTRSCVPLDFTKTVLKMFQTSSVPDFNDVFHRLEQDVIVAADMKGIKPEWPSVTSVLNLAANSFRRLKSTGEWDNVSGNRSRAFTAHPVKSIPENSFKPAPRKLICWNCGDGHHLKDCKKPKDQMKIELWT